MVWGMVRSKSFGEFWPSGKFEDGHWGERLNSFIQSQPIEVQKKLFDHGPQESIASYPHYVSQKFKNEVGTKVRSEDVPFTPVLPHEAPRTYDTEKLYSELGSLIELESMLLAVDDALKAIIERIEPGVHRFFPIEIRMPKGGIFPKNYYTIEIGQYFNSFLPEKSNEKSWRIDWQDYYFHNESKHEMAGLAFSREAFGNAHLWRESHMSFQLNCFSDQLQFEIEKAGLRLPKLHKMTEV
jgi:hypothetical protein